MDTGSVKWKKDIYDRIRLSYGADNPNRLALILAEKFKIKRSTVYAWSDGKSKPVAALLEKISKDRQKPVSYFLTGTLDSPANEIRTQGKKLRTEDIEAIRTETLLNHLTGQVELLTKSLGRKEVEGLLMKLLLKIANEPEGTLKKKVG